jgi:hypothetical protein
MHRAPTLTAIPRRDHPCERTGRAGRPSAILVVTALVLLGGCTGDESATPAAPDIRVPGCEHIMAEDAYCATFVYRSPNADIAFVGLDSGEHCLAAGTEMETLYTNSMVRDRKYLYGCTNHFDQVPFVLFRLSVLTGAWDFALTACDGVGFHDGSLLAVAPEGHVDPDLWEKAVVQFESYDDATESTGSVLFFTDLHGSVIAASNEELVITNHAASEVGQLQLPGGEALPPVALGDEYEDITGISFLSDTEMVVLSRRAEGTRRLTRIDLLSSDDSSLELAMGDAVAQGLACTYRPGVGGDDSR